LAATKDLSVWRVETLRLTVFPTVAPDISGIKWWEDVVGEPPESKTLQVRAGVLQETGPVKGGLCNLSLDCRSQRIDWLFSPILNETQELANFPTFATFPDSLGLFEETLIPWLEQCPPASRIAFGVVLILAVADRKTGYELLGQYLPSVKVDPENSRDFSFQINRPRSSTSGISNLQINRLSRWSVARLSGMVVQVTSGEPTARIFESSEGLDACRVELDINTAPNSDCAIPKENLAALVKELLGLGVEIATNGDIP